MGALFRTTRWSLIDALRRGEAGKAGAEADSRAAHETLCRIYHPAVLAYFRGHGHDPESAEELAQSFMVDRVLQRGLFSRADRQKGRFRDYLRESLRNYRRDLMRRSGARKKRLNGALDESRCKQSPAHANGSDDPGRAFERQWAVSVLEEVLKRGQDYFVSEGRAVQWEVYRARVLLPARHGVTPESRRTLADRLGFRTEADISSVVQRVNGRLETTIRQVLAETGSSAQDVESDLNLLRRILS